MMAHKGELPLYSFSRKDGRHNSVSARRRRIDVGSKRQGGGSSRSLWFAIFCSLGCVAFLSGILIGMELTHTPAVSPASEQGKRQSPHVPPLKHPTGLEMFKEIKVHEHLRVSTPDEQKTSLPPVLVPKGGGVVPEGGGDSGSRAKGLEEMLWLKDHSFKSTGGSYVSIKDSLDRSEEVTAAAWIFIDRASMDMKTVLGNKMSGCGSDALGFALYVNEWEKNDGKLWLEWGSGMNGCEKLKSKNPLPVEQWVHVGFRIVNGVGASNSGDKMVSLFVDGYEVASRGGDRRSGSREEFTIGAFSNSEFAFQGRISAVTMYSGALSNEQFADLAKQSGTQRLSEVLGTESFKSISDQLLVALQLDEAVQKQKDGLEAKHALEAKGEAGTYHFLHIYDMPVVDDNLKDGISTTPVTDEMREASDEKGRQRAKEVKEAMRHAWKGYEDYAFGADELLPRSRRGKDKWGGMGVTLVDSLDTLWLMDMKDEFWKARDWVRDHLSFDNAGDVSVFETTIRELGGLLAAYDLSGDNIFMEKARLLGDRLLPAFNTASGIPTSSVNFRSGRNSGSRSVLAELGTLQVEFRYLSEVTGDPKYAEKVNRVYDLMSTVNPKDGLFPIFISHSNGKPVSSQVTFGALGDSFYEYLLKAWLQGGQKETIYREMYDKAMDGMTNVLLMKSNPSGLTYVSDWNGQNNNHKMDHLVCFLAGTLALGAETTTDPIRKQRDMKTAKALGYTCYQMYRRQKTGLAPEYVNFRDGKDMVVDRNAAYNILRPETAEALFVLHHLTGDPIYREWSYELFQAFEKHCRLPVAYGSFHNVNNPADPPEDRMESFFLAETLKYLYLIQDPDHGIDLRKYVFNTEAHPLRIFSEL